MLFKACGIRNETNLTARFCSDIDFFGINFSPLSKRKPHPKSIIEILSKIPYSKQVYVFKENSVEDILHVFKLYGTPHYIQIYEPDLIEKLKGFAKIIFAANISTEHQLKNLPEADLLILEGSQSGTGTEVSSNILLDKVNRPFLIAGGITPENALKKVNKYKHCIGIDVASGIEENGIISNHKLHQFLQIKESVEAI